MTTGLSFETLLNALEVCEDQKRTAVEVRIGGNFGIAIDQDDYALWFQRRDRQAEKVRKALLAKAAAQEARIRELEDEKNAVYDKWDADCQKQDARIRELEAQAARDAMRIRQLQAQVVKDAVVREAIKTALECLSYRERCWNAEIWDALDAAIVAAEKEAE